MKILITLLALIVALPISAAQAQTLNFATGASEMPIEIDAEDGIEWQQETQVLVARGNAKASRGEVTILAHELRAYYREAETGGTEIWRLDAIGKVRIITPGERAEAEHAVYDVDNSVMVLSGGDQVRLVTATDTVTADEQIEYWEQRQMAVARGNATVTRLDKRIRADVLTAHFTRDAAGKTIIERVEGFDNVHIKSGEDDVTSDRAAYNVESGLARLAGSVKIKRGSNVLTGCSADLDLNSGVSRLNSCAGAGRVQGTIQPGAKKE